METERVSHHLHGALPRLLCELDVAEIECHEKRLTHGRSVRRASKHSALRRPADETRPLSSKAPHAIDAEELGFEHWLRRVLEQLVACIR